MTIPQWTLLGFADWTLVLLMATVGVYRWALILMSKVRMCIAILAARICQSTVHVSHVQTDALVAIRFLFFSVQLVCFLALIVMAAMASPSGKP
jgi:hypothetical protein